jgi:hypothetical protein
MDGANFWRLVATGLATSLTLRQQSWQDFIQRGLAILSAVRPAQLFGMSHRGHAGGLFHDHDVSVKMLDANIVCTRWRRLSVRQDADDFSRIQPPPLIQAQIAVNLHSPQLNQSANLVPRLFRQPGPQCTDECAASFHWCRMQYQNIALRHADGTDGGSTRRSKVTVQKKRPSVQMAGSMVIQYTR